MVTSVPRVITLVLNSEPVLERTWRSKMISMVSGRPRSRLSVMRASKKLRAWRARVIAGGESVGQLGEGQSQLAGLLLGPLVPVYLLTELRRGSAWSGGRTR